ncbi:hypothetical protein QCA50_013504 [Cerrena zonata]|uniref:NAD(P)-binding protein n=1 Tax=Cerrena zonata TaxID=2478898 RepID=A0AAW0FT14_9APHY
MAQSSATTWLVTGGNRGLGLEFVQNLLRDPSNVVITTARNPDQASTLQDLRSKLPQQLHILQLDVTDELSIPRFAKEAEGILGERGLDYLLNNAGVMKADTPLTFKAEDFLSTFKINVLGPALVLQALSPALEKGRRKVVVNVSSRLGSISAVGKVGRQYAATYSACKAAFNMVTVKTACEKPEFIVYALSPGHNKTDLGGSAAPLDPKETIPVLLKFIVASASEHSGKSWDYWGDKVQEYEW